MSNRNRILQRAAVIGRVHGRLPESKAKLIGLAFDEAEKSDFGDMPSKVVGFLSSRLSKEELQAVVDALKEAIDGQAQDEDDDVLGVPNPDGQRAGRPPKTGPVAQDSALDLKAFPHANRLRGGFGVMGAAIPAPAKRHPAPMTPRECEEHERAFPDANRLKK